MHKQHHRAALCEAPTFVTVNKPLSTDCMLPVTTEH